MNIFRFLADLSHMASIVILILQIRKTKSAAGVSYKTQFLYALVFVTRYIDIFFHYVSLYNTFMKIFFVTSTIYILYLMRVQYKPSHDPNIDTFRIEYIIAPSAVLALIINHGYTLYEILWSFSVWLESGAILPQLFMLQRTGEAETLTVHYIFALGIYRLLYIPNWIYRYVTEGRVEPIAFLASLIQTALYSDFFYIYYTKVMQGKKFELPQ
ncbi:hypothetical protein CANCADRAFT_76607 [Tortispora caseinolytica NRRL Y-17796]|uniref:ER lumen protein-retaining receptor n=1 Tax=Tortispora caseinolytica NRRL Y-17796 TaxID=767744 RepID=A0A1E4TJ94_9ASCO|nr:hypothetical protein CANCADRAFT_76607 [Tortispora caseinolytica NRRL Y-17796]